MAMSGFWYVTVHMPAAEAAARLERLAAEPLLPETGADIVGSGIRDDAVIQPVVMVNRGRIGRPWMVRRD